MADELKSVDIDLSSIPSGGTVEVTASFEAANGGTLRITHSDKFVVSPTSVALHSAKNGTKVFDMTITRRQGTPPGSCSLTFAFVNTKKKLVRIT